MRKLDLTPYEIDVRTESGKTTKSYGVRESLIEILFSPVLKLGSVALLRQNSLAQKIEKSGLECIVEEEEYERIKQALDSVTGLGIHDVKFVEMILGAPEVTVEEQTNQQ